MSGVSHLVSGFFTPLSVSLFICTGITYILHQPYLLWDLCSDPLSPALWNLSVSCSSLWSLARPAVTSQTCRCEDGLPEGGHHTWFGTRDLGLFILISQAPRIGLACNRYPGSICWLKEWNGSLPKTGKYLTLIWKSAKRIFRIKWTKRTIIGLFSYFHEIWVLKNLNI